MELVRIGQHGAVVDLEFTARRWGRWSLGTVDVDLYDRRAGLVREHVPAAELRLGYRSSAFGIQNTASALGANAMGNNTTSPPKKIIHERSVCDSRRPNREGRT